MNLNNDDVIKIFKSTEALLEGHFLLTSGRHSNQYFQCAKVLQYPEYTSQICSLIANHFKNHEIDTVIAPAMGGMIVGYEVARQLNKVQINSNLSKISGWAFENKTISKQFQFKDFIEALSFVNAVGLESEKMDHHLIF